MKLESAPVSASIDRVGEIYLLSPENRITKVMADGQKENLLKLDATPALLDPRDGAHLFAFWKDRDAYSFFSASADSVAGHTIDSSLAINPFLICASGERDIIILDSADWSIEKFNGMTNVIQYEAIIFNDSITASSVLSMKEYQNFIFIVHKEKGVLIYNMMGKLLRTLPVQNLKYIAFLGEELYYLQKDTLYFFDLFTTEKRELKLPTVAEYAFITDERLYLINKDLVDLYDVTDK